MIRSEILREIAPMLRDQLVICNIGLPSQELHMIDDEPTNLLHAGHHGAVFFHRPRTGTAQDCDFH